TIGGGSWRTSAIGRPIADGHSRPVIDSAARLNVSTRCCQSAVMRPLGRLFRTWGLSAWRSAISVDACSRRPLAERSSLASDPVDRATAKKLNVLNGTVYRATLRGGRVMRGPA